MLLTGKLFAGLIAAAIIFIGARFLVAPAVASRGYGLAISPTPPTGFSPWLAVKGLRDIVSGLLTILLMTNGSPRLLGEFLLVASLIALGDAAIVLRAGGSRATAFGVHGCTALFMVATGVILIGSVH
jgi:hypothetical protein